eukprot:GDKJ01003675.1.p1 GENE.GDKJ01003675.1~~GDKJ01003675.1.p1  ORF type:complete len:509 (+),score=165.60 GDKJ01003675.1:170-1528(+)
MNLFNKQGKNAKNKNNGIIVSSSTTKDFSFLLPQSKSVSTASHSDNKPGPFALSDNTTATTVVVVSNHSHISSESPDLQETTSPSLICTHEKQSSSSHKIFASENKDSSNENPSPFNSSSDQRPPLELSSKLLSPLFVSHNSETDKKIDPANQQPNKRISPSTLAASLLKRVVLINPCPSSQPVLHPLNDKNQQQQQQRWMASENRMKEDAELSYYHRFECNQTHNNIQTPMQNPQLQQQIGSLNSPASAYSVMQISPPSLFEHQNLHNSYRSHIPSGDRQEISFFNPNGIQQEQQHHVILLPDAVTLQSPSPTTFPPNSVSNSNVFAAPDSHFETTLHSHIQGLSYLHNPLQSTNPTTFYYENHHHHSNESALNDKNNIQNTSQYNTAAYEARDSSITNDCDKYSLPLQRMLIDLIPASLTAPVDVPVVFFPPTDHLNRQQQQQQQSWNYY